jgi:5-methylcytosine-specific restriction endonuclease McrA
MKTRRRISQMSDRAIAKLPARAAVVDAAWDRDQGRCQATRVTHVKCGGALEVHEIIPRSAWAGGELCLDNVILVCREHHRWIGSHPMAAHAAGLHGYSWERNP